MRCVSVRGGVLQLSQQCAEYIKRPLLILVVLILLVWMYQSIVWVWILLVTGGSVVVISNVAYSPNVEAGWG